MAADMWLLKVDVSASVMKKGRTNVAVPLVIQFVSHASLKVDQKSMIKIGSLGPERRDFICELNFFYNRGNINRQCIVVAR